jgi:hypothetical protein
MAQARRKSAARTKATASRTAKRKTARRKTTQSKARRTARAKRRRWSAEVTRRSDALDLENSVFTSSDPRKIARSLKRSAERSRRRKATPYPSAMSMLNFYINRAGKGLPRRQVRVLERAKGKLRKAFGRA